ncbi:MAG: DUF4097 family beta strand repeat-containing protein [Candidatus Aminicenantes bacterium]
MIRKLSKAKRTALWPGLAVIVGLALVAAPALAREKYEEKFEKTEALAKDGKVYLSNISGDNVIKTWKENQVRILALKVSQASTAAKAKENAGEVTIEVTREGDGLRIETKYPKRRTPWGGQDSVNVSVDYEVWVPEGASVEVRSVSGDVDMAPIGGRARVNCVSGDVDILGAAGADVELVSGDLTVENIAGDAYVKAVSGDIRMTGIKGSVGAESVSGDIELVDVSDAATVTGKSVSGDIIYQGTIMPGGRYELKIHSGTIHMDIPASSSFDLEADTFNGVIDSEFEIQVVGKISPREVRGTVGKGGATVRLKSFSGDIELKKR